MRSADLGGKSSGGWWGHKLSKKLVEALWSSGELAIRERRNFIRTYDLAQRVIPERFHKAMPDADAHRLLTLKALEGHGWASESTIAETWKWRDRPALRIALDQLREAGEVVRSDLQTNDGPVSGWIRPADLDLADRLLKCRPRKDKGVLLSPFDPVLWDRRRVQLLFGFELKIEIYTPAPQRRWGYYCLPVLAGDQLVGRVDLKAHRKKGQLEMRARHLEERAPKAAGAATDAALSRFAEAVGLSLG